MTEQVISMKEAKELGLKRYFTGSPCKNGHVSERLVSNRQCVACSAEKVRAWKEKNPEKVREHTKRGWDHYRKRNPHVLNESRKKWRTNNPQKQREADKNWRLGNPGKERDKGKRWRLSNPGKHKEKLRRYRARKMGATPPWADRKAMQDFYGACPSGHEVDHIVPLQGEKVCGLHCLDNLQYLPMPENRAKKNRFYEEAA